MLALRMLVWFAGLWAALACALAAGLMLAACGPRYAPLTPAQVDAVSAAERGWVAAGLPAPGKCLAQVSVRRSPGACGGNVSCLTVEGAVWAIWLDAAPPQDYAAATTHEAFHALYACTLPRLHWSDPYDRRHTNPRVWAPNPGAAEVLAK